MDVNYETEDINWDVILPTGRPSYIDNYAFEDSDIPTGNSEQLWTDYKNNIKNDLDELFEMVQDFNWSGHKLWYELENYFRPKTIKIMNEEMLIKLVNFLLSRNVHVEYDKFDELSDAYLHCIFSNKQVDSTVTELPETFLAKKKNFCENVTTSSKPDDEETLEEHISSEYVKASTDKNEVVREASDRSDMIETLVTLKSTSQVISETTKAALVSVKVFLQDSSGLSDLHNKQDDLSDKLNFAYDPGGTKHKNDSDRRNYADNDKNKNIKNVNCRSIKLSKKIILFDILYNNFMQRDTQTINKSKEDFSEIQKEIYKMEVFIILKKSSTILHFSFQFRIFDPGKSFKERYVKIKKKGKKGG